MSVGGFTLVSVISPGVTTRAPNRCGDVPLAREALADGEGAQVELSGRELNGCELNGRRLGRPGLGRPGLDRVGAAGRAGLADVELSRVEFAVVDLETTGWSPEAAAITEIGAVRVWSGLRRGEFASLVNPGMPVPPGIENLTGITDLMLTAAPPLAAVLPGLLEFAKGCVLVAHNAPFDLGFLVAACGDCGLAWPGFTVLDTVMLARRLMDPDEVPDCKLGTLAGFFRAQTVPSHRALADARATADVLGWLIRRLAHRGIRTLNQLSAWPDVVA
jgi:DNA polymerase-3 subunit epsilon